ncbi:MAG TPA: hypothetical protein DEP72_01250 [Clostridiales bacterium]|nr:MAG: hypothetical protein A2Y18_05735 [Clostridiales bacterium GWD2_32_19]HCC06779.1 hypothetical protein [Clostridiales bacterium]
MKTHFSNLYRRIEQANLSDAYKNLQDILSEIKGNVITIGTGGSYPIASYASEVIKEKNKVMAVSMKPRDILFTHLESVEYVIMFTYSGKTPSILKAIDECKKYKHIKIVVVTREKLKKDVVLREYDTVISYKKDDTKEKSFINIAATLAPISLFLRYAMEPIETQEFLDYIIKQLNKSKEQIESISSVVDFKSILSKNNNTVEVLTGDHTYPSAYILESNLVESGIAYTVLQEKNDYCHGRSILNYKNRTSLLIYLINGEAKKQDTFLIDKYMKKFYNQILCLQSEEDKIISSFNLCVLAMYLSKKIAESVGINLSKIDYPEEIKKIYHFSGDMGQ